MSERVASESRAVRLVPLLFAAVALLAILAAALWSSLRLNSGLLVYGLDDPYIHMSIAKNLVQHHVWGVTRYEFSSASSSPVFTLLLATVYAVTGPVVWVPLALNTLLAFILLCVVARVFSASGFGPSSSAALALLVLVLMPVTALVMGGMEHILHSLLAVMFVVLSAQELEATESPTWARIGGLALTASLLTVTRYEGLALILVFAVLAIARRRVVLAAAVVLSAASSIVVFGAFSTASGDFFLPNSLLAKMQAPSLVPKFLLAPAAGTGHLALPLAMAVSLLCWRMVSRPTFWEREQVMLVMVVFATIAHFQFGAFGWLYRYEAYLVCLLYVAIVVAARPILSAIGGRLAAEPRHRQWVAWGTVVLLGTMVCAPLIVRAAIAQRDVPRATNNIYSQQYQMARFLCEYYEGETVAANDIGAISYYADIRLLDLVGLADSDVLRLRRSRPPRWNSETISGIAESHGVDVAVLYEEWFPGELPPDWARAGEWRIDRNVVCGDSNVALFAVGGGAEARAALRTRLARFEPSLPPTTRYLQQQPQAGDTP